MSGLPAQHPTADLFADDGVHIPPSEPASWARLTSAVGRDGIRNHAEMCISYITDATRTGELTSIGGGRYTVPGEFVTDGTGWVATVEIEVDGELLSRVEFLEVEEIE